MVKSTGRFILSLALRFFLVIFSPFSIAITPHGEERAGLSTFRALICFLRVLVCVSSSSRYQGLAATCDCGAPWTSFSPFFGQKRKVIANLLPRIHSPRPSCSKHR